MNNNIFATTFLMLLKKITLKPSLDILIGLNFKKITFLRQKSPKMQSVDYPLKRE